MKRINTAALTKGRRSSLEMKANEVKPSTRKTNSTLHEPKIQFPGDYVKRNTKSKDSNASKSRSESVSIINIGSI